jgi:hypothetical protein
MFPWQQLNYKNKDQCYQRGLCQGVLGRPHLEFSQLESIGRAGGWCKMAASLRDSCETVTGQ